MKSKLFTCLVISSLFVLINAGTVSSVTTDDGWSQTMNGLQSRLTLVQGDDKNGTRWLVPYLELRNVRDLANQMEVNCDNRHLKVELVNAQGEPIRSGLFGARSGPSPELNTVILPWHSSMTLSLENNNWGIARNSVAMISTDSGNWVMDEAEKGKVFLRVTLSDELSKSSLGAWQRWYGKIQTPLVKVDWK